MTQVIHRVGGVSDEVTVRQLAVNFFFFLSSSPFFFFLFAPVSILSGWYAWLEAFRRRLSRLAIAMAHPRVTDVRGWITANRQINRPVPEPRVGHFRGTRNKKKRKEKEKKESVTAGSWD